MFYSIRPEALVFLQEKKTKMENIYNAWQVLFVQQM